MSKRGLDRTTVQLMHCPRCNAKPGEVCFRSDGTQTRIANHMERVRVAEKNLGLEKWDYRGGAPKPGPFK